MDGEWVWPQADAPAEPTDHIVFYLNGHFVTELTMLKDDAGGFVRLAEMELLGGKYTFEFASMTDEQFAEAMKGMVI